MNKNIYQILIKKPDGEVLADLSDYCIDREFSWVRNRASQIRLTFDINAINNLLIDLGMNTTSLFAINVNEVWVYRNTNLIIAGQINWKSLNEDADQSIIEIEACGWLDLFAGRYTTRGQLITYTNVDIGQIMWGLINLTQSDGMFGSFGVVQGTIQTSRTANREYLLKNIRDALIQLSEVQNSPDFEITPDKKLNVFYPKQGRRRGDTVFTYPGNIRAIGYESDGKLMANRVITTGAGSGVETRTANVGIADVDRGEYRLRTAVVDFPDVSVINTLIEHGNEILRERVNPLILPTIRLDGLELAPFIDYGLGDEIEIKVVANAPVWNEMAGFVRIEAIDISVDENNYEEINLEIVRV